MIVKPNGIHYRMPREEYDHSTRVNLSTLKEIGKSPAHYQHILNTPREDTEALLVGRATHHATFEPELFRSLYVVWDLGPRRGKDWTAFKERNQGMEILTEAQHELCLSLSQAVRNNRDALPLISKGKSEATLFWSNTVQPMGGLEGYEVQCKGRVDFIGANALADLKTCRDGSEEGFGRAAETYGMYVAAAYYTDAHEMLTGKRLPYMIVAVEKAAPYVVSIYEVTAEQLAMGRDKYRGWLDRRNVCLRENHWPGYHEGVAPLTLPRWIMPQTEEDPAGLGLVFGDAATEAT